MSQKQVMPKSEDISRSPEIYAIWTFDTEFPTRSQRTEADSQLSNQLLKTGGAAQLNEDHSRNRSHSRKCSIAPPRSSLDFLLSVRHPTMYTLHWDL